MRRKGRSDWRLRQRQREVSSRLSRVERALSSRPRGKRSWTRWIVWAALAISVVAIVLAAVAITAESKHAQTYVSVTVTVLALVSLGAILMGVTRIQAGRRTASGDDELGALWRSWRFRLLLGLSLALSLAATAAITLSAEGALDLGPGETINRTVTVDRTVNNGRTITVDQARTIDRTVTLDQTHTIDRTINRTVSRTVTVNRTVDVISTLPYTP